MSFPAEPKVASDSPRDDQAAAALADARRSLRAGRADRALAGFRRALALAPATAEAHWGMGRALHMLGALHAARAALAESVRLDPTLAPAHQDLGAASLAAGDGEAALAAYREAARLRPGDHRLASVLLMTMNYAASVDRAALAAAHRAFGRRFPDRPRPPRRKRDGPPRVGLVSGGLRAHSTAAFLPPLLATRDPGRWQAVLYSNTRAPDAATAQFRALADDWVETAHLDDEALARRIAADRIDLLIDLDGHGVGNRLPVFALRPAPVQACWLDYTHSSGLTAVDWFVTDAARLPPGAEADFVERIHRLPGVPFPWAPPDDARDAAPGPDPDRGDRGFAFGCFNALYKVSEPTLDAWSAILRAAPTATLTFSADVFDAVEPRQRIAGAFAARGVDPARLEFLGRATRDGWLARHRAIDCALDPFPFGGLLTTLEALWMGVPVLTFPGDRMAGRSTASVLGHVGLDRLVAADREDYVRRAIAMAGDPAPCPGLRAGLRERVRRSGFLDHAGFARIFADAVDTLLAETPTDQGRA